PVGATIGGILLLELLLVVGFWVTGGSDAIQLASPVPSDPEITNTEAIGLVLYTKYVLFFEASGLILLVAMIGAIILTQRERSRVRRQSIAEQVARTPAGAMEVRALKSGESSVPAKGAARSSALAGTARSSALGGTARGSAGGAGPESSRTPAE
ncbi:MAG: NADH-quinone oxidoreductase subunit J, partial [Pseudomonadota bacterium]